MSINNGRCVILMLRYGRDSRGVASLGVVLVSLLDMSIKNYVVIILYWFVILVLCCVWSLVSWSCTFPTSEFGVS